MWPFSNRKANVVQGLRALAEANHKLEARVFQLEEDVTQLRSAHERLRGAYYATRGKEEPPKPETKADVLRAAGYLPGRPFTHK